MKSTTKSKEISKSQYKYFPNTTTGKSRERITGQITTAAGIEFTHWLSLYVDNSAFVLPTQEDAFKTANLTLNHLKKSGLQMHTGTSSKKPKTEALFIHKQENTNNKTDLNPIILPNGTQTTFTKQFTYLGSIITSNLSNHTDITQRLLKENQAFGSLRSLIFCNTYIPLKLK